MFGNNKINLTFYTFENSSFINEKPTFKSNSPEWINLLNSTFKTFDQQTNSFYDVPTAKNCPGINYFMNNGIKLNMWTDLKIRVNHSGAIDQLPTSIVTGNIPHIVQHNPKQYEYLYQNTKTAGKLNFPWSAQCNKDVKFLYTESHYSTNFFREHNIHISPGIIDLKYQSSLNIHLIFELKEHSYDLLIPYKTPLITLYPITEKKINIDYKLVSYEDYNNLVNKFPKCPIRKYYQLIKNLN